MAVQLQTGNDGTVTYNDVNAGGNAVNIGSNSTNTSTEEIPKNEGIKALTGQAPPPPTASQSYSFTPPPVIKSPNYPTLPTQLSDTELLAQQGKTPTPNLNATKRAATKASMDLQNQGKTTLSDTELLAEQGRLPTPKVTPKTLGADALLELNKKQGANAMAADYAALEKKTGQTLGAAGLAHSSLAGQALTEAGLQAMKIIEDDRANYASQEATVNEQLRKEGIDNLDTILGWAADGKIPPQAVDDMLSAAQSGDWGKVAQIYKDNTTTPAGTPAKDYTGEFASDDTVGVGGKIASYKQMGGSAIAVQNTDGSWDVKPLMVKMPDGSNHLAQGADELTNLQNSNPGKKITSKYDAATNSVTYTATDETYDTTKDHPVLDSQGNITYEPIAPETPATVWSASNYDGAPVTAYKDIKTAIETNGRLNESNLDMLTYFANNGSAEAAKDLFSVSNTLGQTANIPNNILETLISSDPTNTKYINAYVANLGLTAPRPTTTKTLIEDVGNGESNINDSAMYNMSINDVLTTNNSVILDDTARFSNPEKTRFNGAVGTEVARRKAIREKIWGMQIPEESKKALWAIALPYDAYFAEGTTPAAAPSAPKTNQPITFVKTENIPRVPYSGPDLGPSTGSYAVA